MSWVPARLGQIAVVTKHIIRPNTAEAEARPYLGLEQIESNTGRIISKQASIGEGRSACFAFDQQHVLYGKLRPYLNKVALPDYQGRCSTEIVPLFPVGVDREFLAFLLKTEKVVEAAMSDKTGSRMPRADMNKLLRLEIMLPRDIGEQRQIAARLGAELAEVKVVHAAIKRQQQDARRLSGVLDKETSTFLSEMKVTPLGGLLSGIEAGKSFQTSERIAQDNEMGVLKVSAVSWTEFRPSEAKAIDHAYIPQDNHRVRKGDLLISRANTVELVGAVVQANRDYPNRLLSDKTLRLIPDTGKILPDFLLQVLRLPEARAYIENNATGTSDSMRNISQKTILSIPIRLPELPIQQSLVQRFLATENESKRINTALGAISENLVILPSKLLSTVFEI